MAHIEKRGPSRWRARYRSPDGREHSKTFDRRVDAERWLAGVEVSKARGEWVDPSLGRLTFGEWVERWRSTVVDLRPATLNLYDGLAGNHLLPVFGSVSLARIATGDVKAFIAGMLGHASITTTLDRYGHLFPALDEQIAEGLDAAWREVLAASLRPERGLAVIQGAVAGA